MLAVAVLAAGKGTRMKSALPKVLQPLAGATLVERVLASARPLPPERRRRLVGHQAGRVEQPLAAVEGLEVVEVLETVRHLHQLVVTDIQNQDLRRVAECCRVDRLDLIAGQAQVGQRLQPRQIIRADFDQSIVASNLFFKSRSTALYGSAT